MPNSSKSFQRNRKRIFREQINYWRFNFSSGLLRLVERMILRFNVSDVLGADLGQIMHLYDVECQIVKRKLVESALVAKSANASLQNTSFEATTPQYLIHLKKAKVDVLTGLIYLDAGFVVDATLAKWQKVIFRGGIGSAIKRAKRAKKNLTGTFLVFPHTPFYYHVVIDELPNLLKIRNEYPEFSNVLVHQLTEKWTIELLRKFGFKPIISENSAVIVDDLITVTAPRAINKKNLDLLRAEVDSMPEQILIVSRSGAPRSADSIERALMAAFPEAKLVDPGTMSVTEQVEVFSKAKVLIGLHGGALTNAVWMHESGKVLEILNHAYRTKDYENLCNELGQTYLSIEADEKSIPALIEEIRGFIHA